MAVLPVAAGALLAVALLLRDHSDVEQGRAEMAAPLAATADRPTTRRPTGVAVGCRRRSEANFPRAFTDHRNLVIGPLVLVGGAYTPPDVVYGFDGNKFPLLVKAGQTVTIDVVGIARRRAGLAYAGLGDGPLPQGQKVRLRDTARTMTFVACAPGTPTQEYRPTGPSGSYADGEQVTFWSGFVVTHEPSCVPLDVYLDEESAPRRVGLALGARCRT